MLKFKVNALPERFREKIFVDRKSGCWLWIAGGHGNGYAGYALTHSKKVYAHRFSYEFFFGDIPKHLQIDHRCRNKRCVNPVHLEAVTGQMNTMRGMNFPILDGKHCMRGHPFWGKNLYMEGNVRRCRICLRLRQQPEWQQSMYERAIHNK